MDRAVVAWLFYSPVVAGLLRLRWGWLVPMGTVLTLLLTRGPIILTYVSPICVFGFGAGWLVRAAFDYVKPLRF